MFACPDDDGRLTSELQSRATLQVDSPHLAHVWPASLVQRMRKRRCFADSDLDRSALSSDSLLLAETLNDVITCHAQTGSRDTSRGHYMGPHTGHDHDVKSSSRGHPAPGWVPADWRDVTNATLQRGRSPAVGQRSAANDELERSDVTAVTWHSSSSRMTSLTTTPSMQCDCDVHLSGSSSSSSSSSTSLMSTSCLKTTLRFSVESLLAN